MFTKLDSRGHDNSQLTNLVSQILPRISRFVHNLNPKRERSGRAGGFESEGVLDIRASHRQTGLTVGLRYYQPEGVLDTEVAALSGLTLNSFAILNLETPCYGTYSS